MSFVEQFLARCAPLAFALVLAPTAMLASSWAQTTLTTLHTFGGADGAFSYAPVARDRAGNLYGTTAGGGAFNAGAVYKVDTSGNETVLYSFTGGKDGGNPRSGLLLDTAHNLYGITAGGGVGLGQGVIFKLTPDGREIVLHALAVSDGLGSASGLIRDPSGNLYGTTELGGAHNQGVVFKVDVHGTYSILHSFGQLNVNDGSQPFAGVVRDAAGNLYGTTFAGGSFGAGCVFKIDASGHESVLYSFAGGSDGSYPSSTPILDLAGNLYGTTDVGGAYHLGTIFKLDTGGGETILHSFGATGDGKSPFVGLIADSQGNFYGVTDGGGAFSHGSVFKLDNSGNESILYSFTGKGDGARPEAALRLDSAGNLYGTTLDQGTYRQGTVFELTLP